MQFPGRLKLSTTEQILDHYRGFWGADRVSGAHWTAGPINSRLPDLHIATIRPEEPSGMWIYATAGAWRATEADTTSIEVIAVSRVEDSVIPERLGMLAYYHAGPEENRLGVGHRLPVGEPWVHGSTLDSVLLSLPYLWGPKLEQCQLPDRHVQVLWAIPITRPELQLARTNGVEALEQRFETAQLDYLNWFRASVVDEP